MTISIFLLSVVVISMSGVLMPGPIMAFTVAQGSRKPFAGSLVAIGHGVVELPLIALIYLGVGVLFQMAAVKVAIGILGGGVLLWMAIEMLRNYRRAEISGQGRDLNSFVAGILLTAGNPYFLIWWATVGATLILRSIEFGVAGLVLMTVIHWSCDLVWFQSLSWLSFQGGRFFGKKLQMAIFIVCGLAMLYFGLYFIADAVVRLI
ncbi:MAG: LysE family transporter [Desulfobacteraceae bacterium]|nr:LysE family transporter [Desulfobacteraceae bacterium]